MRIIGGHDYYDSAMSFGHDPHVVYVRGEAEMSEGEMLKLGFDSSRLIGKLRPEGGEDDWILARRRKPIFGWQNAWLRDLTIDHKGKHYDLSCPTVILCGKRYQGVRIDVGRYMGQIQEHFFWTAADFTLWLKEHGLEFRTGKIYDIAEYFGAKDIPTDALIEMMNRRWTVLVHKDFYGERECPWQIDQPVLKTVQFFRLLHATTVFQEIDMWIGGTLPAQGNPMVEISDRDKITKHGMDKWSFRKPPKQV